MPSMPGLVFCDMGAWPIVGFLGRDVLLLYWALSHSRKSGDAFEEVRLWPHALDIRRVSAAGVETSMRFNPFFVRFNAIRDREKQVTALQLVSRERVVEIGRFLTPDDKARFAKAFSAALYRAKN